MHYYRQIRLIKQFGTENRQHLYHIWTAKQLQFTGCGDKLCCCRFRTCRQVSQLRATRHCWCRNTFCCAFSIDLMGRKAGEPSTQMELRENTWSLELGLVEGVEVGMLHSSFGWDPVCWIELEHFLRVTSYRKGQLAHHLLTRGYGWHCEIIARF
jgi:hypothetical protein